MHSLETLVGLKQLSRSWISSGEETSSQIVSKHIFHELRLTLEAKQPPASKHDGRESCCHKSPDMVSPSSRFNRAPAETQKAKRYEAGVYSPLLFVCLLCAIHLENCKKASKTSAVWIIVES